MRGRGDSPPLKAPSEHLGRTGRSRPALSRHNLLHSQPTCPLAGPESVSGYPECPIEIKVKAHEHSGREGKVIPGLIKQQLSREATRILKRPFRLPRMSILLLRVTSLKVGWGKAAPPPPWISSHILYTYTNEIVDKLMGTNGVRLLGHQPQCCV